MDKDKIYLTIGVIFIVSMFIIGRVMSDRQDAGALSSVDTSVLQEINSDIEAKGSVFTGQIDNIKVSAGKMIGVGVYDRSCIPMPGGLTQCDAGIETEKYGLLNFKYLHDMQRDPCISPNELLVVDIQNDSGEVIVQKVERSTGFH